MHRALLLSLALVAGCATAEVVAGDRCEVRVSAVTPEVASPGDTVVLTARPLTSHYDTAAWVGDTRALVVSVDRTDCAECDSCRDDQACTACDDCDACASVCDSACVETVSIEVPDGVSGDTTTTLYNAYGVSEPAALTVSSAADDTGAGADSGAASDSGAATDSGASDSGSR